MKNITRLVRIAIILVASFFLLLFGFVASVYFSISISGKVLRNIPTEVDHVPAIVVYKTLYTQDGKLEIGKQLEKKNSNHSLTEILCVTRDKVYFIYCDYEKSRFTYGLASIHKTTYEIETICHLLFAVNGYIAHGHGHGEKGPPQSAFYSNGKIILHNTKQVIQYDIESNSISHHNFEGYNFPSPETAGEVTDNETITLFAGDQKQTFTLEDMSKKSTGIQKIYSFKDGNTWSGDFSRLTFFAKDYSIQVVGDDVYAIGEYRSYGGEAYAIILYDRNSNLWKYVTNYHTSDYVWGNCYLIETVGQKDGLREP